MAMTDASEAIWLKGLVSIGFAAECCYVLWYPESPTFTINVRSKLIDVRYHFIGETISQGTITIIKVASNRYSQRYDD